MSTLLKKIIIHCHDRLYVLDQNDILFCKSNNNYTDIQLAERKIKVSKTLASVSKDLESKCFIRVSQSYLINKNHIKSVDKKKKCIELINELKIQFTTTIKELVQLIDE